MAPFKSCAISVAVMTAWTPGSPRAPEASTDRIRPCAIELRRITACSMPGRTRSSTMRRGRAADAGPRCARPPGRRWGASPLPPAAFTAFRAFRIRGASCANRFDDGDIPSAAAQVAREDVADALFGGIGLPSEQGVRRGEKPRGAKAALQCVMLAEALLQRRKPFGRVSPSTVVTFEPAAWTASIRHERTASPFTITVHAPHTPCSQPTCVPVCRRWCRMQSARVVRVGTSIPTFCPFSSKLMFMSVWRSEVFKRAGQRPRGASVPAASPPALCGKARWHVNRQWDQLRRRRPPRRHARCLHPGACR